MKFISISKYVCLSASRRSRYFSPGPSLRVTRSPGGRSPGPRPDSPDSPGDVADPSKIGSLVTQMAVDRVHGVLKYRRSFYFGQNGSVLFPPEYYPAVKGLFSEFHKADTHTLTLRQEQ